MKRNYHTHNLLCGHAIGSVEDYVKTACQFGFEELGLSDHIPFPGNGLSDRMAYEQFELYCESIEELKQKYAGKIRLYAGAEAEYLPEWDNYYDSLLSSGKMEYLILGQHYIQNKNGALTDIFVGMESSDECVVYAKSAMDAMKTGYFKYLAHPDLFMIPAWKPDRYTEEACDIILNEATKHNYILELNANGLRRHKVTYSGPYFWEKVSKTDIQVIIGADAHTPDALHDAAIEQCENMARKLHLNVIDKIF